MNKAKWSVWFIFAVTASNLLLQPVNLAFAENAGKTASAPAQISLNKASAEELQGINGIGPSLAERIVEFRQANGQFESLEQLKEVKGIGEAKFNKMKQQLSL